MRPRLSAGALGIACLIGIGHAAWQRRDVEPSATRPLATARPAASAGTQATARELLRASAVSFERNTGQHPAAGEFVARGPGYLMSLRANEARVAVRTTKRAAPRRRAGASPQDARPRSDVQWGEVRMSLVGASASAAGRLEGLREARTNYFLGSEPARWRTDVRQFDRVRFDDVYPGVDLVYYGREATLEYDLVVRPGASPDAIELAFDGAREVSLSSDGALVLTTAVGELRQHAPVLYQERDGHREPVAGRFVLRGDDRVAFDVGDYDSARPLVIDPVLQYSTYFGGSAYDIAYELEVDASGAMYIAGETVGTLPIGGFDNTPNGSWDIFVAKFNSAGGLLYSTYYGGAGDENMGGLALDATGNAYVTGGANGDVPTTSGVWQAARNGSDIFVFKLSSTGTTLSYATYLGSGTNFDNATTIAVDETGAAYVGGIAGSSEFPTTVGASDRSFSGGNEGFVTRLNATGSSLLFSTYLGGSSTDGVQGVATSAVPGVVYVTGSTASCDFPTTAGAADTSCNGGGSDAFVTALQQSGMTGNTLVWSTYFGGTAADYTNRIVVEPTGQVLIAGGTSSTDLPAARNSITCCTGETDGFVARLASGGSSVVFSRYLGGYGSDNAMGLALDGAGAAFVSGWTTDSDGGFEITTGAFREGKDSDDTDAFITKVNAQGGIDYSTYVGGSQTDGGTDIAVGLNGAVYLTGWTDTGVDSLAFPITIGALLSFGSGNFDAFLMRFDAPIDRSLQTGSAEPMTIPAAGSVDSSAFLGDAGEDYFGVIESVTVSVHVTHTFDSDLSLTLIGPDGTGILLTQGFGGAGDNYGFGCGQEYQRTTFDDTAASSISAGSAPFNGTYRPLQALSIFAGRSGVGEWRLRATDIVTQDTGAIQCWTVHIRFRSPNVTSIAPATGPLSGGTTVTISGTNFAANGAIAPEVRIGGIPITRTAWTPTSFTGTTNARYAGLSDVVLTDALGRSGVLRNGFTYQGAQTLTVTGSGSGSGTVTSQAGLSPAINCTITSGVASGSCSQSYPHGTNITLTGAATGSSSFTGWTTGPCSGVGACVVSMSQPRAVTAAFSLPQAPLTITGAGTGSGTVTSQAGLTPAINCTITNGVATGACSQSYPQNTSVTLTLTPSSSSAAFWSEDCTGSGACTLVMSTARLVIGWFEGPRTLDVSGTGNGVLTSQPGLSPAINCIITNGAASGACSRSYPYGTLVMLTATPAAGSTLLGWRGNACDPSESCGFLMNFEHSAAADFVPGRTLTVSGAAGTGTVTSQPGLTPAINCTITNGVASGACSQGYPEARTVTLTATPGAGYTYGIWSGGTCVGINPCTFGMSQNRTVTASFIVPPTVTITGAGTGSGTVTTPAGITPAIACTITNGATSGACSRSYAYNATPVVTATPTGGSAFGGWSGCSGAPSDPTCVVNSLVQPATLRATFVAPPSPLTIETMTPARGSTAGATLVTLRGTGLSDATITVGGQPATSIRQIDARTMTFLTPAGSPGAANVTMLGPSGSASQTFTYEVPQDGTIPGARHARFDYDGRYLVFESDVALVTDDTNGVADIYVIDRRAPTAAPVRLSVTSQQLQALGGESVTPAISSTGRVVAFASRATNLVPGDTNGVMDVFVHDRDSDVDGVYDEPGAVSTTLVSVGAAGVLSDGASTAPTISGSGRWVGFVSLGRTLGAGANDAQPDIFVRDRALGTTVALTNGTGASGVPAISLDGRCVAFQSDSPGLVSGDTNGLMDVFLHDRDTDEDGVLDETGARLTIVISLSSTGVLALGGASRNPSITQEGRWTVFESEATNLVVGDSNGVSDIFIHDRVAHTTIRLSRQPDGTQDTAPAVNPVIAANGSRVHYVRNPGASEASVARAGVVAAAVGSEFGDEVELPDPTNPNPPPPNPPDSDDSPTSVPCVSGDGQSSCSETPPDTPGTPPETDFEGQPPPPGAAPPVIFDWSSRRGYWNEAATVEIEGQGFTDASRVFVEGHEVTTERNGQSLRIHLPALSAPAPVQPVDRVFEVRNGSLASGPGVFSYDPSPGAGQAPARSNPVVDALTVTTGYTTGGAQVTVQGSGFEAATVVVDGVSVTPSAAQSTANALVIIMPPHAAGIVAIATRNGDGVTASRKPTFEYVLAAANEAPVITRVAPNPALAAGNTPLTIAGAHFAAGATVTVGGVAATQVVVVSDVQIQALAPPLPAGVGLGVSVPVSVTVGGRSGNLPAALSYIQCDPFAASPDGDSDGLPRDWECAYGLSDSNAGDAALDADGDGPTNLQEKAAGTHPLSRYTRYFAEGATGPYFTTRITIANPNATPATVLMRVLTDAGTMLPKYLVIPAMSIHRVTVDDDVVEAGTAVAFSTVIESDVEVVADRTMLWDERAIGSSAETSLASPALRWYLAEGATGGNFYLFYLLQNPSLTETAHVRIRYLRPTGSPVERLYTVGPGSRLTIEVDRVPGLEDDEISGVIEVMNNVPVIAERAMYITDPANPALGFVAGHESAGVTAQSTQWFLAEGATGPFFDFYVLLANPNPQQAELQVTYLLDDGTNIVRSYSVAGNSRRTIYVNGEDPRLAQVSTATKVVSTNGVPIVVERAMWWPHGAPSWQEAHNSAGSTITGEKWGLAEGETARAHETRTYILIANTASTTATVRVTLLFEPGADPVSIEVPVLPNSRRTIDVAGQFPASTGRSFGAIVESLNGEPIVVERAMYSNALGVTWAAGTNALGTRLR